MSRFLVFLSIVLVCSLTAGCKQPEQVWKVPTEVLAQRSGPNSIVWGSLSMSNLHNLDSGVGDVFIRGIFGRAPSARLVFRDEITTREFITELHGEWSIFFFCPLPKGEYRLTVDVTWPDRLRWMGLSSNTVRCNGDGQAIFIGRLAMGTRKGRTLLFEGTTSFDAEAKKFLADNPEYKGEIAQQIVAPTARF